MTRLVIVGVSQILSDLVDAAFERGWTVSKVLEDQATETGPRDLSLAERLTQWAAIGVQPQVESLADYQPQHGEALLLGPTTPARRDLAARIQARFDAFGQPLPWATLIHPSAIVSPLASLGAGSFVGAGSVLAPGVVAGQHVFINRAASVGHDTRLGDYCRVQPGAALGGLIDVGEGCTIGLGARVLERLHLGAGSFVAAGAVVVGDVEAGVLVAGVPAKVIKRLQPPGAR